MRHSLSHAVIVFTSAVVRLIITNFPTHKEKKLRLLPALSLASPRLMWRETFSAGHREKAAPGASVPCTGAKEGSREETEKELRRLPRGAILLALLELSEICSGRYETFAFAFQLKCGN